MKLVFKKREIRIVLREFCCKVTFFMTKSSIPYSKVRLFADDMLYDLCL